MRVAWTPAIRHQLRFAIAVLAITVSFWLASSIQTQVWYAAPFLLAIWIRPAPPRPKHDWSRRDVLPMLLFLAVMGIFAFALDAAGKDSPFTTWSLRLLFLGGWPFALYAFARDAAATFPDATAPTSTSEPPAP
jgi:hypothetical protein